MLKYFKGLINGLGYDFVEGIISSIILYRNQLLKNVFLISQCNSVSHSSKGGSTMYWFSS